MRDLLLVDAQDRLERRLKRHRIVSAHEYVLGNYRNFRRRRRQSKSNRLEYRGGGLRRAACRRPCDLATRRFVLGQDARQSTNGLLADVPLGAHEAEPEVDEQVPLLGACGSRSHDGEEVHGLLHERLLREQLDEQLEVRGLVGEERGNHGPDVALEDLRARGRRDRLLSLPLLMIGLGRAGAVGAFGTVGAVGADSTLGPPAYLLVEFRVVGTGAVTAFHLLAS